MRELSKNIADLLFKKLNENTKDIYFDVSLFNNRLANTIDMEEDIEGTYHTVKKQIVPTMITDIPADFVNLPNTGIVEGSILSTMLILADNLDQNNNDLLETFLNVNDAIDEVREKYIGKTLPLGTQNTLVDNNYSLEILPSVTRTIRALSLELTFYNNEVGDLLTANATNALMNIKKSANHIEFYVNNTLIDKHPYSINEKTTITMAIALVDSPIYNILTYVNGENSITTTSSSATFPSDITSISGYTLGNILGEIHLLSFGTQTLSSNDLNSYITSPDNTKLKLNSLIIDDFKEVNDVGLDNWNFNYDKDLAIVWGFGGIVSLQWSLPYPTGNQFTIDENNYQEFLFELSFSASKDVFMGEQCEYYLDGVRIFPVNRDSGFGVETDSDQVIDETTTKSIAMDTTLSKDFTLFYQPKREVINLIKHITNKNVEMNKKFVLKEVYPLFVREYDVLITSGGTSPTIGAPMSFSISFMEREQELDN